MRGWMIVSNPLARSFLKARSQDLPDSRSERRRSWFSPRIMHAHTLTLLAGKTTCLATKGHDFELEGIQLFPLLHHRCSILAFAS